MAERHTFLSWVMTNATGWPLRAVPQTVQTRKASPSCHPSTTQKPLAQTARKAKENHITIHLTVFHEGQQIHARGPRHPVAPPSARLSRSSRHRHLVLCAVHEPGRRRAPRGAAKAAMEALEARGIGIGMTKSNKRPRLEDDDDDDDYRP